MLHNASIYLSDFKAVANRLILFLMQLNLITCKWLYQKLMHNFQFFTWRANQAGPLCHGISLVSLQEWGGAEHKGKFSDLVLFAFEQCCWSVHAAFISFSLSHFKGVRAASLNQKLAEMFFQNLLKLLSSPLPPPPSQNFQVYWLNTTCIICWQVCSLTVGLCVKVEG